MQTSSGQTTDQLPLQVAVVYALPEQQCIVELRMPAAATVLDALNQSGLLHRFPELALRPVSCAVFSRVVALTAPLRNGDRVEILRPLLTDPKEKRRQAAARARKNSG